MLSCGQCHLSTARVPVIQASFLVKGNGSCVQCLHARMYIVRQACSTSSVIDPSRSYLLLSWIAPQFLSLRVHWISAPHAVLTSQDQAQGKVSCLPLLVLFVANICSADPFFLLQHWALKRRIGSSGSSASVLQHGQTPLASWPDHCHRTLPPARFVSLRIMASRHFSRQCFLPSTFFMQVPNTRIGGSGARTCRTHYSSRVGYCPAGGHIGCHPDDGNSLFSIVVTLMCALLLCLILRRHRLRGNMCPLKAAAHRVLATSEDEGSSCLLSFMMICYVGALACPSPTAEWVEAQALSMGVIAFAGGTFLLLGGLISPICPGLRSWISPLACLEVARVSNDTISLPQSMMTERQHRLGKAQRRRRAKRHHSGQTCATRFCGATIWSWVLRVLLGFHCPPFYITHPGVLLNGVPLWVLASIMPCSTAAAPAGEGSGFTSSFGTPIGSSGSFVPIEGQTTYAGQHLFQPTLVQFDIPVVGNPSAPSSPWVYAFNQALTLPDQPRFVEDPLRPEEERWIGGVVYTPYVRAVPFAVRCTHWQGLQHCLDVIKDSAPGVEPYTYNVCIPTRPQRFREFLSILRFPSSARGGLGQPVTAVLLDLTAVGGRYFACYLARTLPYQDLISFITPQIQESGIDLVITVGEAQEPHTPGQLLQLEDGDVISVALARQQSTPKPSAAEICADRACWGPLSRLPYFGQAEVVLVQYHQKQFCISMCRQYDRTLTEVLAHKFELDPEEMTTCAFRTPGLELHGEACSHVVMLVDLPAAQIQAPRRARRRDYFVLCDLRGLGGRVRVLHSHSASFHLPSVAAMHYIHVPWHTRIAAVGGSKQEDDIVVDGNCVLSCYLEPTSSEEEDEPPSADDDDAGDAGGNPPGDNDDDHHRRREVDHRSPDAVSRRSRSRSDERSLVGNRSYRTHKAIPTCTLLAEVVLLTDAVQEGFSIAVHALFDEGIKWPLHEPTASKGLGGPRLGDRTDFVAQAADQGLEVAQVEQDQPTQRGELEVQDPAPLAGPGQALADGVYLVTCLVYAPDYIPDIVVQAIAIPCSVNHAIAAFSQRRDPGQAACFDQLFPAAPQPDNKLAVMVALPSWETQRVVILFNCLAHNRTLFAAAVFPQTNKASLLHAAGIREHHLYDIFLHGLLQPVLADQRFELRSGATVYVAPIGTRPGPSWNLEDMLQDPADWDFEAPIPGPPPPAGNHFWVLSEGIPKLFRVERDRRRSVIHDIARAMQYTSDHVTIQPTRPRIIDHLGHGCPTWAVVVATENLQTLPCPPARRPETRTILVLDCRAILAGFRWQLVDGGQITVQEVADQFHEACPPNFLVVLKGADIFHSPAGQAILVPNGLVVKIEFVEEVPLESEESEADEHMAPDEDMHQGSPSSEGSPAVDEVIAPATERQAGSEVLDELSPRSRSPRDSPADEQDSTQEVHRSGSFRAFGILAPGYREETVQVKIPAFPLLHHATLAVQAAREANYAQAFPLLQPVSHQPSRHRGYYLATPLWPYQGAIVCVDMLEAWCRIFAAVIPPETDRGALLTNVGLSPAADVDLYVNGMGPITQQLRLKDGDCLTILWRGMPAPIVLSIQSLLEDTAVGQATIDGHSQGDDSHYYLVEANGCQLFSLRQQRSAFYRADIASRVGCDPNELKLMPTAPRCEDASMFGFDCCAVVAALRVGHLPLDAHICVSFIDARRLLQTWLPIATADGWVFLPDIRQALSTSVPEDWCVYLEGTSEEQIWWYGEPGSVLIAACRPAEGRLNVTALSGTQDLRGDEATEHPYGGGTARCEGLIPQPHAQAMETTASGDASQEGPLQRGTQISTLTGCLQRIARTKHLQDQTGDSRQLAPDGLRSGHQTSPRSYVKLIGACGRPRARLPLWLAILCHATTRGDSMHLQGVFPRCRQRYRDWCYRGQAS